MARAYLQGQGQEREPVSARPDSPHRYWYPQKQGHRCHHRTKVRKVASSWRARFLGNAEELALERHPGLPRGAAVDPDEVLKIQGDGPEDREVELSNSRPLSH